MLHQRILFHNLNTLAAMKLNIPSEEHYHKHTLESYTIFIELAKAFDTVHHCLLCCTLEKYGLLSFIIKNVEKLYNNCKVKIKAGKNTLSGLDCWSATRQQHVLHPVFVCLSSNPFLTPYK
jgi:hypothetical protein